MESRQQVTTWEDGVGVVRSSSLSHSLCGLIHHHLQLVPLISGSVLRPRREKKKKKETRSQAVREACGRLSDVSSIVHSGIDGHLQAPL